MLYRIGLPFWKLAARRGVTIAVPVRVFFDGEASVYFATSPRLHGLAVEALTLDELREEVRGAIDDLMDSEVGHTGGPHTKAAPQFSFRDRPVAIA
jgi:hypothetical protein